METLRVLSIDVGIINLGYTYSELKISIPNHSSKYKARKYNNDYKLNLENLKKNIVILDCNRVDITNMKHNRVCSSVCTLRHDRCIPDYIDHLVQEIPFFEECDVLLIEQQPPQGIQNVQDLLFKQFRHKVCLVSPNSIHKYFQLPGDYLERKERSEKIAETFLSNFSKFTTNDRKHDISDALLMTIFYYKTKINSLIETSEFVGEIHDFDKFRFKILQNEFT
jgi:hypothetical protein